MKIIQDYYIVGIDQSFETSPLPSGIIPVSETWVDPKDEESNKHKRAYGTVLTCPESFSDYVCRLVDLGLPPHEMFVGHDIIQSRVNAGFTANHLPRYYPSSFDVYPTITLNDISKRVNVKAGERIYFDHNAIQDENYLGDHNKKPMYKIRVDQIYCSVKRVREDVPWISWIDKIEMQGGWALVQPDMETWDDITLPSGIIIKSAPAAKYLIGFIRHIGNRDDLRIGDRIMYMHNSDAPLTVEKKDYFIMMEDDIIIKL